MLLINVVKDTEGFGITLPKIVTAKKGILRTWINNKCYGEYILK